jgi:hypothetical protein
MFGPGLLRNFRGNVGRAYVRGALVFKGEGSAERRTIPADLSLVGQCA